MSAIVFFLIILVLPIIWTSIFITKFNLLSDRKMKAKYSVYYDKLALSRSREVVFFPVFFLMRRLILALAVVTFD